jgi:hypothetical protein
LILSTLQLEREARDQSETVRMKSIEIVGGILVFVAFILGLIYKKEALDVLHAIIDIFR